MHFPMSVEQGLDIVFGKKIRRAMGSVGDGYLPLVGQARFQFLGQMGRRRRHGIGIQVEHVTLAQRPPAVAAELAEREGGPGTQVVGTLEPPAHQQIGAGAVPLYLAQAQDSTGGYVDDAPRLDGPDTVIGRLQFSLHDRAGKHHLGVAVKTESAAIQGHFQARRVVVITEQGVAQPEGKAVERTGGRHAHTPVTDAARGILNGGHGARRQHFQCGGPEAETIEKARVHIAVAENRRVENRPDIRQVCLDTVEPGLIEGGDHGRDGFVPGLPVDDELGEHGIEERRDLDTGLQPVIDAQSITVAGGEVDAREQARRGLEIAGRILGIDAHLEGVAGRHPCRQRVEAVDRPGTQANHPRHQVHAIDLFGDTVFHLQAGVHFQKVGLSGFGVVDKFHRAGTAVSHGFHQRHRTAVQVLAQCPGQIDGRGFLDDFLVSPLAGTVPLPQGHGAARAVTKYLYLDMAGPLDKFLQEHPAVGEVAFPQAAHAVVMGPQFVGVVAEFHADTATAGGGLEHHRVADIPGGGDGGVNRIEQSASRQQRHTGLFRQGPGSVLKAKGFHLLGSRAQEHHPGGLAAPGKTGVLAEKPVARMHRAGAAFLHHRKQLVLVEIGIGRPPFPQRPCLVGQGDVAGACIGLGIDGDTGDAHCFQGPDDADRNGTAVGDQYFTKHKFVPMVVSEAPFCGSGVCPPAPALFLQCSRRQSQTRTSMGVGL